MCHIKLSDKGWLRQYIPLPSSAIYASFVIQVKNGLGEIKNPDVKQMQQARMQAYQLIMGVVA